MTEAKFLVAVVGAGPAGLFGARELAGLGARVAVFNRDLKPGGLAEYGIYPDKHVMKEGLRKQFRQVLETPGVSYFGNLTVGRNGDLTLEDLRALGFQAILVTAGAQGTKWLGLPGEDLTGVYHAKDVVYFYNRLPPFSRRAFRFGRRCAVVGAGNVMLDIARYLTRETAAEDVVAVVRRGPAEVKFDRKEMEYVIANMDRAALEAEFARVAPAMRAIGQDPDAARDQILEALPKALPATTAARFRFEFLASPVRMLGDAQGNLTTLEVEDNTLALKDGEVKARGTGNKRTLEVETVVFAIGDKVDDDFGLPIEWNEFVKNPSPRFPVDGISFEAYDPAAKAPIEGVFVAGWSRQASTGLVGYARKDGISGARAVWQYLQTLAPTETDLTGLQARLAKLGKPVITAADALRLFAAEQAEAARLGKPGFKFDNNEDMLRAMGAERVK